MLSCLIFDATCLDLMDENATQAVEVYMQAVTQGFGIFELLGVFSGALTTFALSRWGGIPVPWHWSLWIFWGLYIIVLFFQYAMVMFSLIMTIWAFFALRDAVDDCLLSLHFGGQSLAVLDVCAILTCWMLPLFLSHFVLLFIYSYVGSTCLKVASAAREWGKIDPSYPQMPSPPPSPPPSPRYQLLHDPAVSPPPREETADEKFMDLLKKNVSAGMPCCGGIPLARFHLRVFHVFLTISILFLMLTVLAGCILHSPFSSLPWVGYPFALYSFGLYWFVRLIYGTIGYLEDYFFSNITLAITTDDENLKVQISGVRVEIDGKSPRPVQWGDAKHGELKGTIIKEVQQSLHGEVKVADGDNFENPALATCCNLSLWFSVYAFMRDWLTGWLRDLSVAVRFDALATMVIPWKLPIRRTLGVQSAHIRMHFRGQACHTFLWAWKFP